MTAAGDVRLTEEQKNAKQAEADKKAREIALLRKDLNDTFGSSHGMRVLRFLMESCGYLRPSIIADTQNGNPLENGTIYNEARRNLYLSIRRYLRHDILIPVEHAGLDIDEKQTDIFS